MKKFSMIKIAFGIFMAAILLIGTAAPSFAAKNNISALGSEVSNQKKYTMYLGTNDKDSQVQEIPTATIRAQMHEICMKYVSGYTVSEMEGFYRDDAGNDYHEVSLVYVFIDAPIDALKKIMDEALVKFNQSSILLEESKGKSTFYSGK